MRFELLPGGQIFDRLGDLSAVGREVLQRADPRIEGDHRRLALLADQQRRDQSADLLDLRQNALHVRVGLQARSPAEIGWYVTSTLMFCSLPLSKRWNWWAAVRRRSFRRGRRPAPAWPAPPRRRRGISVAGCPVGSGVCGGLLRLLGRQKAAQKREKYRSKHAAPVGSDVFGLPSEQFEHVRYQLYDSIQGFHRPLGRPRQSHDQNLPARSGQRTRQHGQRRRSPALQAHQLAKTGDFTIQNRAGRPPASRRAGPRRFRRW